MVNFHTLLRCLLSFIFSVVIQHNLHRSVSADADSARSERRSSSYFISVITVLWSLARSQVNYSWLESTRSGLIADINSCLQPEAGSFRGLGMLVVDARQPQLSVSPKGKGQLHETNVGTTALSLKNLVDVLKSNKAVSRLAVANRTGGSRGLCHIYVKEMFMLKSVGLEDKWMMQLLLHTDAGSDLASEGPNV
ncbi:hypothetical protein BaRGS_00036813 [Batillaria attramentaria]|uniref:Uncharacterized protein n=1 Tax=Batillaria attramentaria TaxID=370345 RepID=A0ABD0JAS1_9CAEN